MGTSENGKQMTHGTTKPSQCTQAGQANHCFVYTKMGNEFKINWVKGTEQVAVLATFVKMSICKYHCKVTNGKCNCMKNRCGVKKLLHKCVCSSGSKCPTGKPCDFSQMDQFTFPAQSI